MGRSMSYQSPVIEYYILGIMRGSCHLDTNIEIFDEYQIILVVVFFNVGILGHFQGLEKVG